MKLHGQTIRQTAAVAQLRCFDDAVVAGGDSAELFSHAADGLMMRAIDLEGSVADDFGQKRVFLNADRMDGGGPAVRTTMVESVGCLAGDIYNERAPEDDVEHLMAAADPEKGFALRKYLGDKSLLPDVAFRLRRPSFLENFRRRSEEHT